MSKYPLVAPDPQRPYQIPAREARSNDLRDENTTITPTVSQEMDTEEDPMNESDSEPCTNHDDPAIKRIYNSPRLTTDDENLFPTDHSKYQDAHNRWNCISEQAGLHRQVCSSLTIRDSISPLALKCGIVSQVAVRVRSIQLWYQDDSLPLWLDVIATIFPNLQHLRLFQDRFEGEEEIEVSARMRRLYVLYRLPDLKSIDDSLVTHAERKLARPSTPNGERVRLDSNRPFVMQRQLSLLDDEDDEVEETHTEHPSEEYDDDDNSKSAARTLASESMGNQTAMELGADLAHLAQQVAIVRDEEEDGDNIRQCVEPHIDENALVGEQLVDMTMSMSLSGEQREDQSSNSETGGSRDEEDEDNSGHELLLRPAPAYSQHSQRSIAVMSESFSGHVRSLSMSQRSVRRSIPAPSRVNTIRETPERKEMYNDSLRSTRTVQRKKNQLDNLDLVSVASSQHEWTAACGVLSFRSDRACAPRLRLNFVCGRGNRKRIADEKEEEDTYIVTSKELLKAKIHRFAAPRKSSRKQAKTKPGNGNQRSNHNTKEVPSNEAPNNTVRSPLRDKYTPIPNESHPNDLQSANQRLPPSKSLSSPFPMQFRERTSALRISTAETDLTAKPRYNTIPSSPRARGSMPLDTITEPMTLTVLSTSPPRKSTTKTSRRPPKMVGKGGLPPPCPPSSGTAARRKVVASSLLQQETKQARKARKMERRKKAARSTSVFDLDEEDEDDDDDELDDEEPNFEHVSDEHALYNGYQM